MAQTDGPYFVVEGERTDFPLQSTDTEVDISGVIANVSVRQSYRNDGERPIEATYVFPASTGAAVHGMDLRIGARTITGVVMRKREARQTYQAAKNEGKRAGLLEQERPNVFQMRVANILPGETVEVHLRYTEMLVPEGGLYRFVYPTTVGPRFTGEAAETQKFAAQPYRRDGVTVPLHLSVSLDAGMPVTQLDSPTHAVSVHRRGGRRHEVSVSDRETEAGNRDFVLEYRLGGEGIHTGLLLYEGEEENFFLYLAQPPASGPVPAPPAREYVFIVDVSGSMHGFPLDVTQRLLEDLVGTLRPVDRFNVLVFAGASETWRPASVAATPTNLEAAIRWLRAVPAGGGTELLEALQAAYSLPTDGEAGVRSRNFVVVTDGYVTVEPEAFELIERNLHRANVYTFGIGSGVNRYLIEGMARVGRGRPAVVTDVAAAPEEAARFRRYIAGPLLTDLHLDYGTFDAYDLEPLHLPDLSTERPLVVYGKYRGRPSGELVLSGRGSRGEETSLLRVKDSRADKRNAGLAYLWARSRIARLDDYNGLRPDSARIEEVTRLGLGHNLLTAYTSFVAVDRSPVVDDPTQTETVQQALPLPAGVASSAVGFTLGVAGVSGLPTVGAGLPWWSLATVAAVCLCFLLGYRKLRGLTPVVALACVLSGCGPSPREVAEEPVAREAEADASGSELNTDVAEAPAMPSPVPAASAPTQGVTEPALRQEAANDVTFILGRDKADNPYYERAERYFREQGQERMVRHLESLAAVRYYLESRRPAEGWGDIHLVVHGNPWSGIAVGRNAAEQRTTAQTLSDWSPEPLAGITERTRIVLHGCGLGMDRALLRELSRVFGGEAAYPEVVASEQFTLFREGPRGMERHYADAYFRARPLGDYPLPSVMAVRFGRTYPQVAVDWEAALARDRFADDLMPYLYQFNVPAEWVRVHAEGGPAYLPEDRAEQTAWLESETGLVRELARIGLTHRDFRWSFDRSSYRLADGTRLPAARARGTARLFCVLVPVDRARTVSQRYIREA